MLTTGMCKSQNYFLVHVATTAKLVRTLEIALECIFDVHKSVHRDTTENNQQYTLYRLINYSELAVYVSGDDFAHHQKHLTLFTVSGSVHPSCCRG
jgi:hypothetical protein